MKKHIHAHIKIACFIISFIFSTEIYSQSNPTSQEMFDKLSQKDSLLFNAIFNTCDFKTIESMLSKDFVFYQDKGYGNPTSSQPMAQFIADIQKNFCANKTNGFKMKREVVKGSLQVSPISEDKVMQTGVQRFYMLVPNKENQLVEESKFYRTWQKQNNDWRMTQELDYLVKTKFASEPGSSNTLYNEVAHMDSVLFDAFNTRNLEKIKTLFSEDLEFYHDLGGLTLYAQNMETFKTNFANNIGLKRELVKGSLEVYPIKNYGAIQVGLHKFCHPENGKDVCGTFKFVHVWQKKDGVWKITRVVSYDH